MGSFLIWWLGSVNCWQRFIWLIPIKNDTSSWLIDPTQLEGWIFVFQGLVIISFMTLSNKVDVLGRYTEITPPLLGHNKTLKIVNKIK